LDTTQTTEVTEPAPTFAIRDEIMDLIRQHKPEWGASKIDNEPIIGIETDSGEYFIEVQDA
jgi:hypothetical protein